MSSVLYGRVRQVKKTSCHQQESSASALWTDGKFIGCKKI
nr:MAG TPA: hypothetical protein [Caudoviricetes sp.]